MKRSERAKRKRSVSDFFFLDIPKKMKNDDDGWWVGIGLVVVVYVCLLLLCLLLDLQKLGDIVVLTPKIVNRGSTIFWGG